MVRAFQQAVAELGGTITADATYQLMRQQSVGYAERMIATQHGWDWHDLRAGYQRWEPQLQHAPAAFAGAQAVLAKVSAVGGHNYLMTHRDESAQRYLEQAGLAPIFHGCGHGCATIPT
jgi:beta-phosphoglucomutase-like phosphatase (HAD superfamily)